MMLCSLSGPILSTLYVLLTYVILTAHCSTGHCTTEDVSNLLKVTELWKKENKISYFSKSG